MPKAKVTVSKDVKKDPVVKAPTAPVIDPVVDPVVPAVAEKPVKTNKTAPSKISVSFRGGIREFSEAIHGENFMDVAKEFAETQSGTIVE